LGIADCGSFADAWAPDLRFMDAEIFKGRTKAFALRVIRVVESLPRESVAQTLGRQLLRSGTSVAANYRASTRARSRPEFVAKLGIVEEECDESLFWMELLVESGRMPASRLAPLQREGSEILAMTVASIKSARRSH
jgi:four helix bundle protein